MRVLSLFDGISGAQVALRNLGVIPFEYYASEINPQSIKITQLQFPNTIQVGDVNDMYRIVSQPVDLFIFGSPCTDLSVGRKNRQSLAGKSSGLFYRAAELLKQMNPQYFLMENVASMTQDSKEEISKILGVQPVEINSKYFTGQSRTRLYWCNWKIAPTPNVIKPFSDLLLPKAILGDDWNLSEAGINYMNRQVKDGRSHWDFKHHSSTLNETCSCIVSNFKKGVPYNVLKDYRDSNLKLRKFHVNECERLQGFQDDYTKGVADTHRYEMLGNAFTIPVIEHILRPII